MRDNLLPADNLVDLTDLVPNSVPDFIPLIMLERPPILQLPDYVNIKDPITMFDIFLPRYLLEHIVTCTNQYTKISQPKGFRKPRTWSPTRLSELLRYLACQLYMGLHPEGYLEDYWNEPTDPVEALFTVQSLRLYPSQNTTKLNATST